MDVGITSLLQKRSNVMTFRNMLSLLAGSVGARLIGAALGLLTQIIIARSFDQSEVGVIFLTMSFAAIISLIVAAGYPTLALTELPRLMHHRRSTAISAMHALFLKDWFFLTLAIVCATLLIVFGTALESGVKTALVFGVLSSPASATIRYASSIANSLKRFAVTFVPDNIIRPGAFMLFIVATHFLGYHPSLQQVLWAFVFSNVLAAFVQLPFVAGHLPSLVDFKSLKPRFAGVMRGRSYAIAVVAAVATMFADIITLLGGFFLPSEDVALLGVTIRLAAIGGFVVQSAQQFATPDLAVTAAQGDKSKSMDILWRLNVMTLAIMVAGLVFTYIFGNLLLQIFGETYKAGYWLLVLFVFGQTIRAFSGMNQVMLSMAGKQLQTAWSCVIAFTILLCLWVIFVKSFGLLGVGYAVVGAELAWFLLLAAQAQALTGSRGDVLWLLAHRHKKQG